MTEPAVGSRGRVASAVATERQRLRQMGLERHHYVLLGLLGAAAFFDGYDGAIKMVALTQLREAFDLSQSGAAVMLCVVYLGSLPAIALTRLADRVGRRRMLVWSVVGYTTFSGLTALAQNAETYAAFQFCQQIFLVAESALVWTMAAEALPARARGFGFGILGMLIALGNGTAAIVYGLFLESLHEGWRWLYVIGVPPLLLVSVLRRRLPESRRFEEARDSGRLVEHWQEILRPPYRRWLVMVIVATFLLQFATEAGAFALDFLQTDRGISAQTASLMLPLAGLPGIPIMVIAGGLSDRFGRRVVGCGFGLACLVGGLGFFWLPGGIPVLLPSMSLMLIGTLGSFPVLSTFVTELFPTPLRGSASSWSGAANVLGRAASLGLGAILLERTTQSWTATLLGLGTLAGLIMVYAVFPADTHGRELEDTSGEDVDDVTPLAAAVAPPL